MSALDSVSATPALHQVLTLASIFFDYLVYFSIGMVVYF